MNSSSSLWEIGFRPFFLAGSLHAALVILIWVSFMAGIAPMPGIGDPILWHAHEMIYGFSTAIIAGFLLTAVPNWSDKPAIQGRKLQLLLLLWALPRLGLLFPHQAVLLFNVLDLAFYPTLGAYLLSYFKDPELKFERIFYLFFTLLFIGCLQFHFGDARQGLYLGLNTVLIIIVMIGGRVIPFFTEGTITKVQPKKRKPVEIASIASTAAFAIAQFFAPFSMFTAAAGILAAVSHFARLWGWQVPRVRRVPLLWVLHIGYLWLVLGFLLSALAALGHIGQSHATHALTVGAFGIIIYGMITRVSLGHTGRRLRPNAATVVGYVLLNISALVRVFGPALLPSAYTSIILTSGVLWVLAFLIFIAVYTPILISPRVSET